MPRVLITPTALYGLEGEFLTILRAAGFEVAYPARKGLMTEAEMVEQFAGVSATLCSMEPYTDRVFAAHPQFRVAARVGVGWDAVDTDAATRHGVAVTIAPGTNQDAVAEHTFALMLALAKNVIGQHLGIQKGQWPRKPHSPLRGKVVGLVGLGRIGKAVAVRARAFNMTVLAAETFPDREFCERHDVSLVPLDELLAESDFVSLHVPSTAESKYLINAATLARMKMTACLINTARGALVNEADLLEALKTKRIAGAGLDVFEKEPPGDNPLLHLENVVLTAHTAGVDDRSLIDMAVSAAQAVVDLAAGRWPGEKVVNPEVRTRFRWA